MATRNATIQRPGESNGSRLVTWEGMKSGDAGAKFECVEFPHITFQVFGTFGPPNTQPKMLVEGSNDGDHWFQMRNSNAPGQTDVVFTEPQGLMLNEIPRYIRPRVTGGDLTTDLTASVLVHRDDVLN